MAQEGGAAPVADANSDDASIQRNASLGVGDDSKADKGGFLSQTKFSDRLEDAINDVLATEDELAKKDFDPIKYINELFPTEQSLSSLDSYLIKMKTKIRQIDDDMYASVRKQSGSGPKASQDLQEARTAIQDLFGKIQEIKKKAHHAESTVQEICRDIKSLDHAKTNLTTSITALKRLHMLVTAVEQLNYMTTRRQYREAANLLEAVNQLSAHFDNYRDIPRIRELKSNIGMIQKTLHRQIFDDFKILEERPGEADPKALGDSCLVVSAMGVDAVNDLANWFVNLHLGPYRNQFTLGGPDGTLESTEKRYTWLKHALANFEDNFSRMFPVDWNVRQQIAEEFCRVTRKHLTEILDQSRGSLDVNTLVRVLQRTIEFEKEFSDEFVSPDDLQKVETEGDGDGDGDGDGMSEDDDVGAGDEIDPASVEGIKRKYRLIQKKKKLEEERQKREEDRKRSESLAGEPNNTAISRRLPSFRPVGTISTCFDPYMATYIEHEDKNMGDYVAKIVSEEKWTVEENDATKVLNSSAELFMYIKKSLNRCATLTRVQTLHDLYRVFKKHLKGYGDALTARLPQEKLGNGAEKHGLASHLKFPGLWDGVKDAEDVSAPISDEMVGTICLIVNTGEYCYETSGQLQDSIKKKIDNSLAESIDLSQEQDHFSEVINKAIKSLGDGILGQIHPVFAEMVKQPWGTWENVGDQSEFVDQITTILSEVIPRIAAILAEVYFKFFCDRFVSSFLPLFISNLFKCKKISEFGAQQLLLDASTIKKFLLDLPTLGNTGDDDDSSEGPKAKRNYTASASYCKIVTKEMTKAENILKLVLSPPEQLVEQYRELMSDGTTTELQKILDLKGLRKVEQQGLNDQWSTQRASISNKMSASMKDSMSKFNNLFHKSDKS